MASCWGLIFAIFRRSCPRNTSETTRRDLKKVADKQHFPVFSDASVDIAMPSPCKGLCNNYLEGGGSKINRGGLNLNQSAG